MVQYNGHDYDCIGAYFLADCGRIFLNLKEYHRSGH